MNSGDHEGLLELVHPEIEATVKLRGGQPLRGIAEAETFFRHDLGGRPLFEVSVNEVLPLDDRRVVVEARMRWMDDDRVLRDDPVVWAFELENGQLRRSTPVRTVAEAEAILSAAPREPSD